MTARGPRPLRRDPLVGTTLIAVGLLAAATMPDAPWPVLVPLGLVALVTIGGGLFVLAATVLSVLMGHDDPPD